MQASPARGFPEFDIKRLLVGTLCRLAGAAQQCHPSSTQCSAEFLQESTASALHPKPRTPLTMPRPRGSRQMAARPLRIIRMAPKPNCLSCSVVAVLMFCIGYLGKCGLLAHGFNTTRVPRVVPNNFCKFDSVERTVASPRHTPTATSRTRFRTAAYQPLTRW